MARHRTHSDTGHPLFVHQHQLTRVIFVLVRCSLMRLVLNPDGALLSDAEVVQLEGLLATYLRKQGFALPGR